MTQDSESVVQNAYRQVRTAIANGVLIRPPCCSKCGALDQKEQVGRHTIQGHHHRGYHRPLDVEWLCCKCHRAVTPLPEKMGAPVFGQVNGASRLTNADVAWIRTCGLPSRKAGAILGVNKSTVLRVRDGTYWSHVA